MNPAIKVLTKQIQANQEQIEFLNRRVNSSEKLIESDLVQVEILTSEVEQLAETLKQLREVDDAQAVS